MPALTPEQLQAEIERIAGRGIEAAARFYNNRLKEALSVPAPRVIVISGPRSRTPGAKHYRATTPAGPGAPPRKLSGKLRREQQVDFNAATNVARVGSNVEYARALELGKTPGAPKHPFLEPTLEANLEGIGRIVGEAVSATGTVLGGS